VLLNINYECPTCNTKWNELYECACDSECPECGESDIIASDWTEATPEQIDQATKPRKWLVTRTVLESLFIEARNKREAIDAAIGIEAGWTRSIDREDYDCTPPPAGGFILGLPIV